MWVRECESFPLLFFVHCFQQISRFSLRWMTSAGLQVASWITIPILLPPLTHHSSLLFISAAFKQVSLPWKLSRRTFSYPRHRIFLFFTRLQFKIWLFRWQSSPPQQTSWQAFLFMEGFLTFVCWSFCSLQQLLLTFYSKIVWIISKGKRFLNVFKGMDIKLINLSVTSPRVCISLRFCNKNKKQKSSCK